MDHAAFYNLAPSLALHQQCPVTVLATSGKSSALSYFCALCSLIPLPLTPHLACCSAKTVLLCAGGRAASALPAESVTLVCTRSGLHPSLHILLLPNPGPAARRSKASSQGVSVGGKGKVALFQRPATGGGEGGRLSKGRLPPPDNQGARAFIDRGRGLPAETAQSALTGILKLVMGGLTSIILIVLGTISLQFQSQFVSTSLRPILGIVAAYVMATAWSTCS